MVKSQSKWKNLTGFLSTAVDFKKAKNITRLTFFIAVWLILWLVYGDVLFVLQDNSLWIFASPSEFKTLLLPSDILTYISRFLLTFFAVKWLGSLVVALFLSIIEVMTDYILRVKFLVVSYIPSLILLCILFSTDYDLYYENENSLFFKILLITTLVILVIMLVTLLIRGRRKDGNIITYKDSLMNLGILGVLLCFSVIYAIRDTEFMRMASIKYYANNQNWSKVAKLAEKSKNPTKGVAAYHAIAIAQMGQIGDRLFRISHDFDPIDVNSTNLKKKFLEGGLLYAPYIYLHSGLVQTAYHYSMEEIVMCGSYKSYLKVMTQAALLCREKKLVDKLLDILAKTPFEGDFVKKYRYYNNNPGEIIKDPILASIIELKPVQDTFEQVFETPLYVSYYDLLSGGSDRALDLSLASCLYKKDLNGFASRCGVLMERKIIPRYFQEALVMMCQITNPTVLQQFNISHEIYNSVTDFYNELDQHIRDKDKGKKALKGKFGKTYMYYNTFENKQKK